MSDCFYMDIKRITVAHEFVLDRANRCEYPNGRSCYGLVYVLEGTADYRFTSGEKVTVTSGNLLYLSPSAAYSINTEKSFRHYTVNFEIYSDTSALGLLEGMPYCISKDNNSLFEHSLKRIVSLRLTENEGGEMEAVGWLYTMLPQFYAKYTDTQYDKKNSRLSPAREYIRQNFYRSVSLGHLAGLCSMSVTNFRREWKKRFSDSPLEYRDSLCIRHANELISSGYYTVGEIAERCGFNDVSYFIRFYKKHTGTTPGTVKAEVFK